MKFLGLTLLFVISACSSHRHPASIDGHPVAFDTMASGKIRAQAIKRIDQQDVCFDISVSMNGFTAEDASPANWSLAWVDQKNQYHLLRLNQRDPASVPQKINQSPTSQGSSHEWSNTFRTCASKAELKDVSGIVLTPKELPYDDMDSLNLNW